ncbi:nuclear transport factor 2 family protein [Caballeronia sp. LjRoot34]|uniref:nuclear transport factor 2 family protein n=1 Tax=Caballeronia sp. LjRoot34 TaxID=3342325 RepID=UPI003ED0F082
MTDNVESTEDVTKQIFEHHLGAFAHGVDEILKDYDDGSTILTPGQTYRGLAEIRDFFQAFIDSADPAFWPAFKINSQSISGQIAYMAWEAKPWVTLATDTLFVEDGKIAVQTYTAFSS